MKDGWKVSKLQDVCEKITDGTHQTPKYFEEGVVFLSSKNIKNGKLDWNNVKYIDQEQHLQMHKRVAPKVGDILLAKNGTTGVAAIVDRDVVFDIYVSLAHIRSLGEIIPTYMLYFINSPMAKRQFNSRLKGIGVPNLHLKEIREVNITYPASQEQQQQIVKILDQAFEKIDQAIANIKKNINNAEELFQSKLNEVFSQKGEGWEEKKLGEIGVIQTGTTPPTKDKTNYGDYISFIKPAHFRNDGSIDAKETKLSEKGIKKGRLIENNSILMVCIGATIGKTGYVTEPVSCNQQINSLTPNDDFFSKIFYYALISPFVQKQVMAIGKGSQATLPIINKTKWSNLKVRFPKDYSEQEGIVENLSDLRERTNFIIETYKIKGDRLTELKKSLLEKAFKGELIREEIEI